VAAAIGTDPPLGNAANSFGSIRPGIATAASVVMVVSEAVARRMSACNPDVEKTAQPAFADCGLKTPIGGAHCSLADRCFGWSSTG
jgi:hypothetical protein